MVYQIAELPEVDRIYLIEGELVSLLNVAVPTTKANAIWDLGFQGTGQRVAVLEDNTIPLNHPNINVIAIRNEDITDHASAVGSAIASDYLGFLGMAPLAEIVSAGIDDSAGNWFDTDNAILWAHDQYNVHIMNASFTTSSGIESDDMEWIDRVFDYYARYYRITMIASAGNQNVGNHIGSPAKGYNVLAVGATDDKRTSVWDDDMWINSSWENPKRSDGVYGDREKPEVVASGVGMTILNRFGNPVYLGDGTSLSSPLVAGLAALLADRAPALYEAPEALRAIIMATAWNNIEGPTGIPTGLDLKDGAGAIDASSADAVATIGYTDAQPYPYPACQWPCWWSDSVTSSDFDPYDNYRVYQFMAKAGERVRVALTWDSNALGAVGDYAMDPLQSNFDLVIFDPDMIIAPGGYSGSWDNSYELVDFYALKTGDYTIGVYKRSMNETSNWIGLAWTKSYHICMPLVLRGGGVGQADSFFPYPAPEGEYNPVELFVSPYPAP